MGSKLRRSRRRHRHIRRQEHQRHPRPRKRVGGRQGVVAVWRHPRTVRPAPRRWNLSGAAELPGFNPVLGRVLAGRGHDLASARALFDAHPAYHDPFLLPAMKHAVDLIADVARRGLRIAVYGDYDADGVTACAMLTRTLRSAGVDVLPYIPNRMTEGYGLHAAALEELAAAEAACVITVDCGTSSVDVARGRPAGMRLVVTDHHLPLAPHGGAPQLAPVDALI